MGTLGGIPLEVGDVLANKYRLERLIGEGGTGVVVVARHLLLEHAVAIKFLRAALSSQELRLRFEREARAIDRIASDHVVAVYDVGTLPDGEPYMVMEHLEGRDLSCVLKEDGKLPLDESVDCMLQVCEALGEAHARGIIHRDLKPANLFLTRRKDGAPHVKVVDFGISKILDEELLAKDSGPKEVTAPFTVLGSPRYMAPEQLRSAKDVDSRADLWSVGVVLFELVTGAHAFAAEDNVQASLRVLTGDPVPLRRLAPEAPPGLEAIVARCLAKERAARFQSARELADALRPFASSRTQASIQRMQEAKAARTKERIPPALDVVPPTAHVAELRASTPMPVVAAAAPPAPVSSPPTPVPSHAPASSPTPPSSWRRLDESPSVSSMRRAYVRSPSRGLKIAVTIGGVVAVVLCFVLLNVAKLAARRLVASREPAASSAAPAVVLATPSRVEAPRDPVIVPLDAGARSP